MIGNTTGKLTTPFDPTTPSSPPLPLLNHRPDHYSHHPSWQKPWGKIKALRGTTRKANPMEFLSVCPQQSWRKTTVSASAKKKRWMLSNTRRWRRVKEEEKTTWGRPTTGQTNTSWFLFSMATWWLCIDPQVPQVQQLILIRTIFLPYKHLARSKRKIVQEILFFFQSQFIFLYYMLFFYYLFVFQFIRKGDWSSEYSRFRVCLSLGLWACTASYSRKQSHSC